MEKSKVFLRGQIWYWTDPVYGSKEEKIDVPDGEKTMRYSRYVLIVQDDRTIMDHAILVIPLSSQNHGRDDVPINISFLSGNSNECYAKCQNLSVVGPSQMRKYICTLSEEGMKKIDKQIIKLLLPEIGDNLGIRECNYNCNNVIALGDSEVQDVLPIEPDTDEDITVDEKLLPAVLAKKGPIEKKWTDARIEAFVKTYVTRGQEAACELFNLAPSSAQRYIHTWKKMFVDVIDEWVKAADEKVSPGSDADSTDTDYDVDIIHRSLSTFSNIVKESVCIDKKIYSEIYLPNEYKQDRHMDENVFYNKLGSIFYFSFMQFMEIDRYDDGTLVWMGDDPDGIRMAFFFMRIFETGILNLESAPHIMAEFRRRFERPGLDEKWGELLFDKIKTSLNINKEGAVQIYQIINKTLIAS